MIITNKYIVKLFFVLSINADLYSNGKVSFLIMNAVYYL